MTKPQSEAERMASEYDKVERGKAGLWCKTCWQRNGDAKSHYLAGFKAAVDFVEKEAIKAHHRDELKSKDFVGGMYEVYFRLQKLLGKES